MTRSEFLDRLREALGNDLNVLAVQENVDYYNQYIADEVNSGRSEDEVIKELGDPWVIARTIIGAAEAMAETGSGSEYYEQSGQSYRQQGSYVNRTEVSKRSWWSLIVMLLGVLGVLIAVVAVIGGIISLVAPILVPVLIVMIIVRALRRRQ